MTIKDAMLRITETPLHAQRHMIKIATDGYNVGVVSTKMNDAQAYAIIWAASPEMYQRLKQTVLDLERLIEAGSFRGDDMKQANDTLASLRACLRGIDDKLEALNTIRNGKPS